METLKAISLRKSVRAYKDEQISNEILDSILEAGCQAPVGSGQYESLHITVIQDIAIIKKIVTSAAEMAKKMVGKELNWDFGAKTLIVVSSTPAKMPGMEYANVACVLENMVLAATDQNVDSIIWGGPTIAIKQNNELRKCLGIPDGYTPILCASFGYAVSKEAPKSHSITWNKV